MKDNIILPTKNTSFMTSKQKQSYIFMKVSHHSSLNALSSIIFLFNGIASV
jgi:hypothetical protein